MDPLPSLIPFDAATVVAQLRRAGAVSVPMIPEELRHQLWEEAWNQRYAPARRHTGYEGQVEQQMFVTQNLPQSGILRAYIVHVERHLTNAFDALEGNVFACPLQFDEYVLQKYLPTKVGISPHRDFSRNRHLIAVNILGGHGEFTLCDNRDGENPRVLDSTPGNVILLRAAGFAGPTARPWHAALNITSPRIVLTMRERA